MGVLLAELYCLKPLMSYEKAPLAVCYLYLYKPNYETMVSFLQHELIEVHIYVLYNAASEQLFCKFELAKPKRVSWKP